jgi:hypothetical protein
MGVGIKEMFSDVFIYDLFGLVTGTFGVNQFPNVPCSMARLRARSSNAGSFFISHASGTVLGMPYELDAGEDTGWFPTSNLNLLWHGGSSGTSDFLAYWVQR